MSIVTDGIPCALVLEDGTIRDLLVMSINNLDVPGVQVIALPEGVPVGPDWTFDGENFIPPAPPEPDPEQEEPDPESEG
jgi:hypothetical protein